jgi:hypothetical protein
LGAALQNGFGEPFWRTGLQNRSCGEQRRGIALGHSFGEQLWTIFRTSFEAASGSTIGILGSFFGTRLSVVALKNNFGQLWEIIFIIFFLINIYYFYIYIFIFNILIYFFKIIINISLFENFFILFYFLIKINYFIIIYKYFLSLILKNISCNKIFLYCIKYIL